MKVIFFIPGYKTKRKKKRKKTNIPGADAIILHKFLDPAIT